MSRNPSLKRMAAHSRCYGRRSIHNTWYSRACLPPSLTLIERACDVSSPSGFETPVRHPSLIVLWPWAAQLTGGTDGPPLRGNHDTQLPHTHIRARLMTRKGLRNTSRTIWVSFTTGYINHHVDDSFTVSISPVLHSLSQFLVPRVSRRA